MFSIMTCEEMEYRFIEELNKILINKTELNAAVLSSRAAYRLDNKDSTKPPFYVDFKNLEKANIFIRQGLHAGELLDDVHESGFVFNSAISMKNSLYDLSGLPFKERVILYAAMETAYQKMQHHKKNTNDPSISELLYQTCESIDDEEYKNEMLIALLGTPQRVILKLIGQKAFSSLTIENKSHKKRNTEKKSQKNSTKKTLLSDTCEENSTTTTTLNSLTKAQNKLEEFTQANTFSKKSPTAAPKCSFMDNLEKSLDTGFSVKISFLEKTGKIQHQLRYGETSEIIDHLSDPPNQDDNSLSSESQDDDSMFTYSNCSETIKHLSSLEPEDRTIKNIQPSQLENNTNEDKKNNPIEEDHSTNHLLLEKEIHEKKIEPFNENDSSVFVLSNQSVEFNNHLSHENEFSSTSLVNEKIEAADKLKNTLSKKRTIKTALLANTWKKNGTNMTTCKILEKIEKDAKELNAPTNFLKKTIASDHSIDRLKELEEIFFQLLYRDVPEIINTPTNPPKKDDGRQESENHDHNFIFTSLDHHEKIKKENNTRHPIENIEKPSSIQLNEQLFDLENSADEDKKNIDDINNFFENFKTRSSKISSDLIEIDIKKEIQKHEEHREIIKEIDEILKQYQPACQPKKEPEKNNDVFLKNIDALVKYLEIRKNKTFLLHRRRDFINRKDSFLAILKHIKTYFDDPNKPSQTSDLAEFISAQENKFHGMLLFSSRNYSSHLFTLRKNLAKNPLLINDHLKEKIQKTITKLMAL